MSYYIETDINNRQPDNFLMFLQNQNNRNNNLNGLIQLMQQQMIGINNWDYFNKLVLSTIAIAKNFEADARNILYEYIKQEQDNINKLLTGSLES